jgi:hypothetical protein
LKHLISLVSGQLSEAFRCKKACPAHLFPNTPVASYMHYSYSISIIQYLYPQKVPTHSDNAHLRLCTVLISSKYVCGVASSLCTADFLLTCLSNYNSTSGFLPRFVPVRCAHPSFNLLKHPKNTELVSIRCYLTCFFLLRAALSCTSNIPPQSPSPSETTLPPFPPPFPFPPSLPLPPFPLSRDAPLMLQGG